MSEHELAREEVENAILEHMKAIKKVYLKYNPDGNYLSMFMTMDNGYFHVNNACYDHDLRRPIDASWFADGAVALGRQNTAQ